MDRGGDVYVADSYNWRVQKFRGDGTFVTKWGSLGSGDGQFGALAGVAVDGNGNVFVADVDRVQRFTSDGTFVLSWGSFDQFFTIEGIAVDVGGNVFVASTSGVQKFLSFGFLRAALGQFGIVDDTYVFPLGVAADRSGNVYVTDTTHHVQKFACP